MSSLQPKLSDMRLRQTLVEMLFQDLLGPAGGPDEEVTESSVRNRYLAGVLAPTRRSAAPPVEDDEEEADHDLAIPDELALGGTDSADDGTADKDTPVERAQFPSSIGMTLCVSKSTQELQLEASWGQYLRESRPSQINPRTGKPQRVWKRYPRGGTLVLKLKEGPIKPVIIDPKAGEILIKGRARKRDQHWIVTLFLVNNQAECTGSKDQAYLFQPSLKVGAPDSSAIFEKKLSQRFSEIEKEAQIEEAHMEMLYRHSVEFAVGHGVSVHVQAAPESPDRATAIMTQVVPSYEVPRTTPPTAADAALNPAFAQLSALVLDMKVLAESPARELMEKLQPLITAYRHWIEAEKAKINDPAQGLADYRDAAEASLEHCRKTATRIEAGLQLLKEDPKAFEAFAFMNKAMWQQRTHALHSERVRRGEDIHFDALDIPANRTWYPFQLAFILLNLPGITQLNHPDRDAGQEALADLLFFPTGGGKTEAYLGLSAYTMALRRLQGRVAGRDGEHGVAVLMRYTLRLLTIQQFQRATALLCACEAIRRTDESKWGKTPFRIGLWVGSKTTPNRTDDAAEAVKQARSNSFSPNIGGTPYQLTSCPWCGSPIEAGIHLEVRSFSQNTGRTLTFCGDRHGLCLFSRRNAPNEGLPVVVVDEEIYRQLPSLLIATVDKFAQMPWKGEVQTLFGTVSGYCTRHGFRSPELEDSNSHLKTNTGLPAATTQAHPLLRPPDLIIQDELHLISGPLGTLVGLYETAVDKLCTWEVNGEAVRPKVIASTATIKNAGAQVHKLFMRKVNIFPPPALDIRDNFFSLQRAPSENDPGRIYLGICAPGRRLKAALIRVYTASLCAGAALYEKHGVATDPWLTLVGYFNSVRELAGMRRLVDDDISSLCRKMNRRGLAVRKIFVERLEELTSRKGSDEIPQILDRLERLCVPILDGPKKEPKPAELRSSAKPPLDVLLATNMISVGVDVKRLGLMVVAGQPKATAEYIQATSRVGRSKPGLVICVYNWARPRDLSHYQAFEHYHATFYKQVEPLSITPFSPGAMRRGLAGLLVSLIRLRGMEFNANEAASKIQARDPYVEDAIKTIAHRAGIVGDSAGLESEVQNILRKKMDVWQTEAQNTDSGRRLEYQVPRGDGSGVALLCQPKLERWDEFTCLNSLRDVEPPVKFILHEGGLDETAQSPETIPTPTEASK